MLLLQCGRAVTLNHEILICILLAEKKIKDSLKILHSFSVCLTRHCQLSTYCHIESRMALNNELRKMREEKRVAYF